MSMILPKLWSNNSNAALLLTLSHLKKYKHLINFKKDESILEFGFADGRNSSLSLGLLLPNNYKEFVATDISHEMVEYAKQHCDIPRSKFIQFDICSKVPTEFQNRFDHIFGFHVIHLVKKPRQAFKNIYNMLKPGGSTFLNFFERIPMDDIFDRLSRHPKWGKYGQEEMISTYFRSENPKEEYKKDIAAAGFTNYVFEANKQSINFASEEECNNLLISVNAIVPKIPENEYEEYIKDYLKEKERAQLIDIIDENGNKQITFNFTGLVLGASK